VAAVTRMPFETPDVDVDVLNVQNGGVRFAKANRVDIRQGGINQVEATEVNVRQGGISRLVAKDVAVSQGGIAIARADRVSVEMGGVAIALAGEARVSQSFVRALFARDARIQQGGAWNVLAGRVTFERSSFAGVVIARRVEGNVKTLLDWRGALALGGVIGVVLAVVRRR
jgi:large exoprotein involved in heme utilization and adhesion